MSYLMQIENEVPFGKSLYAWLCIHDLHLDRLVKHDRIEEHYLAWETVRKQTNPYFIEGTGFEGYLIGFCHNPEEALSAILRINQEILDSIARSYRFEYRFRSRLMKTLTREVSDRQAIHLWSAYLGATVGRLRSEITRSRDAEAFRSQTYQLIRILPPMIYHEVERDVFQTYAVASYPKPLPKIAIVPSMLKPSQQDAWLVADHIGEFGHPLIRKILDQ